MNTVLPPPWSTFPLGVATRLGADFPLGVATRLGADVPLGATSPGRRQGAIVARSAPCFRILDLPQWVTKCI
eukprot:7119042-Prymnesium_polylepis.1